jgi:hypothetical protein
MPGPLHAPPLLILFPFRFHDPVSRRWVRARYVAERHVIAARYDEWEIIGPPEIRRPLRASFTPWRS